MPSSVIIENPVINSPFEEPGRHFKFTEDGITDEIVAARRTSQYFIPIPPPKKKGPAQLVIEGWTADRVEENQFINRVRARVALWRRGGYPGITQVTARLLKYWQRPGRERRLFFAQIEALETIIYVTEVASKYNDAWIENELRRANQDANPELYRIAFKMATGSGKTVVMGMLIAWHTLNKLANPQDARFSDAFLIVTPGITIRDRLRVLFPNDPQNYYRQHDLVPPDFLAELGKARLVITNFHAFKPRERVAAGKITKQILRSDDVSRPGEANDLRRHYASPFTETPDQMARRVCRALGTKKNIIVINDEAHHCYRRRPEEVEKLIGDDRKEAEKSAEDARVWISGLEAVKAKIGVKVVYDLSATPFFLRGSGYSKITADGKKVTEGILFPWVVSDFSLIDAIESGIVKVSRVPVSDNRMVGELPTYRNIWPLIREGLPKSGRSKQEETGEPLLPAELEGALQSLYSNYEQAYRLWEQNGEARSRGQTPPVFIVVCNNTNVSNLVFKHVSGGDTGKHYPDGRPILAPGKLPLFSNVSDERWLPRPNTILVDSEQLESGEGMSADFKQIAALEIAEFKAEYSARFPGRDAENLTDEDLLREVMNTVGKAGKLGEQIRCVVSVSMLTEGWDANTVTHILGVRAFGTQLLCEQVVGRGLRRMSYAVEQRSLEVNGQVCEIEAFQPEYAEVYGVPFSFIPSAGSAVTPTPPARFTRVRALDERIACEITFPRIVGYRYELPGEKLSATFDEDARHVLSTADLPTRTEVSSIIGESNRHTLYGLKDKRLQAVDFDLARRVLETYFRDNDGNAHPWLFPQLWAITRRWRETCLICHDDTFPQMLLIAENAHDAADKVYHAIIQATAGESRLLPTPRPYDPIGSTRYVDFDTSRETYKTAAHKCHVSHVVLDSGWEAKMAETLEEMDEVACYVKNYQLGFNIPYTLEGQSHSYVPDYLVCVDDGCGSDDLLTLIVEVSGEARKDKAAKTATARHLWVPAVNNAGIYGRWAFIEVTDPWDAANTIRAFLRGEAVDGMGPLFRQDSHS
jgi:type III restriction enzyme